MTGTATAGYTINMLPENWQHINGKKGGEKLQRPHILKMGTVVSTG